MIVFDLRCSRDHRFEAWFGSSDDYHDQRGRGLLGCPVCNDPAVEKAVMAPAVPVKGNRGRPDAPPADLKALRQAIEAECDDVGSRFGVEARLRHAAAERGEPARGCIGQTSLSEAKQLVEEGIPVAPLPFRPRSLADA